MDGDEEAVLKEEQRLLRSMNNRVNTALRDKPKANFSFTGSNTPVDVPKASAARAAAGTFGAHNALSPAASAKLHINEVKPPSDAYGNTVSQVTKTEQGKPEIVKSSNPEYNEEMKRMFADDHEKSIKMEEERLTRALGRRGDKDKKQPFQQTKSVQESPERILAPHHVVQEDIVDNNLAPTAAIQGT
jgi:hypothetical protein